MDKYVNMFVAEQAVTREPSLDALADYIEGRASKALACLPEHVRVVVVEEPVKHTDSWALTMTVSWRMSGYPTSGVRVVDALEAIRGGYVRPPTVPRATLLSRLVEAFGPRRSEWIG